MTGHRAASIAALPMVDRFAADDLADVLWLLGHTDLPGPVAAGPGSGSATTALDDRARSDPPARPTPRRPVEAGAEAAADTTTDVHLVRTGDDPRPSAATELPHARHREIPERLAVQRALRPLKRLVDDRRRTLLDETATAHRSAQAMTVTPVMRPARERWLDVALVVDTGASMALWQRLAVELRDLLERHGAFRDVRGYWLDSGTGRLHSHRRRGTTPGAGGRPPRALADPTGRRHVLVLTDGVGEGWTDGTMDAALDGWARAGPVAILHALPPRLWRRANIATEPVWWHAVPSRAGRTASRPRHPASGGGGAPGRRSIPVLGVDPTWIGGWAGVLAGTRAGAVPGVALHRPIVPPAGAGPDRTTHGRDDAVRTVTAFRTGASTTAVALAGLLTAAPLSLPVMRLVQQTLLPRAGTEHLAEVFLSGLLVRDGVHHTGEDPDSVVYDFVPHVRDLLRNSVTRQHIFDVLTVLRNASSELSAPFGGCLDYRLLVPDSEGRLALPPESQPFAEVAVANLRSLGGEFARLADRVADQLARLAAGDPADPPASGAADGVAGRHPGPRAADPLAPARSTSVVARPGPRTGPSFPGWLRRLLPGRGEESGPALRFGGVCPLCGAALRTTPDRDPRTGRFVEPPSLRLEIGSPDTHGERPWRVSVVGVNFPPAMSTAPGFVEPEIEQTYVLCGDGHFFPDPEESRVHGEWRMVAVVGAPASGKTAVLSATLNQRLDDHRSGGADWNGVRRRWPAPLEAEVPLSVPTDDPRSRDTRATVTPRAALAGHVPDAVEAITDILARTVGGGTGRRRSWGRRIPQPVPVRSIDRGRPSWTGLAEVPAARLTRVIDRSPDAYDTTLWVVDPTLDTGDTWETGHDLSAVNRDLTRANRAFTQISLGHRLAAATPRNDAAPRPSLLVVVAKCDLVFAALTAGRPGPGRDRAAVVRGTATHLTRLAADMHAGRHVDAATATLLHALGGPSAGTDVVRQHANRVAEALVTHYSSPTAFWNLVHHGERDHIGVAPGPGRSARPLDVTVPSLDEHLHHTALPGSTGRLLGRDLVMSAVACGLAYGAGLAEPLSAAHGEGYWDLRFSLCSARAAAWGANGSFGRSAGLAQLFSTLFSDRPGPA
ncbi:hypothetical protein GCM10009557_07220 [Virgisporangium ochraceum]